MNADENKQAARRAAVYVRVAEGRPEADALAERQRQDCLELCTRLGLKPIEVHEDIGTSSWRGGQRSGFEELLDSVRDGVGHVVVWRIDMLYRHAHDLERLVVAAGTSPLRIDCVSGCSPDLRTSSCPVGAPAPTSPPSRDGSDEKSIAARSEALGTSKDGGRHAL